MYRRDVSSKKIRTFREISKKANFIPLRYTHFQRTIIHFKLEEPECFSKEQHGDLRFLPFERVLSGYILDVIEENLSIRNRNCSLLICTGLSSLTCSIQEL